MARSLAIKCNTTIPSNNGNPNGKFVGWLRLPGGPWQLIAQGKEQTCRKRVEGRATRYEKCEIAVLPKGQFPKGTVSTLLHMPLTGLNKDRPGIRNAVRDFCQDLEMEMLASGGGKILAAVQVHSACLSLRNLMRIEDVLADAAKAGKPGLTLTRKWTNGNGVEIVEQKGLTLEQWAMLLDKQARHKYELTRTLTSLLGAKPVDDMISRFYEEQRIRQSLGQDDDEPDGADGAAPTNDDTTMDGQVVPPAHDSQPMETP
jgi:hypothetical protein